MGMIAAVRYNLANLTNFGGRATRFQFWPYAAFVFILSMMGGMAAIMPEMAASMRRMQEFAIENPELATVQQGPGGYSISIEGHHPELMPNMSNMMIIIALVAAVVVALLASSVARRLHDCNKSGLIGLMPLPFLAFGLIIMPKLYTQRPPDVGLFFALFANNLIYIISLITLAVLLARSGTKGNNRYGAEPMASSPT